MIGLIQRVTKAQVDISGQTVGAIEKGICVLVGVEKDDTQAQVKRMCERLLTYRMFPDGQGRMNCNVQQAEGGILLVSQFTLLADTSKGTRASFLGAGDPAQSKALFEQLVASMQSQYQPVASGQFAADMQVTLTNDGPVTFWLQAK